MTIVHENGEVVVTVRVKLSRSLLEMEQIIQKELNKAGCVLMEKALSYLDTDGSPIKIGNRMFTSKGQTSKNYETSYGTVNISRHIYQDSKGGDTFCPLDHDGRILGSTTPQFANIVSYKYAELSASRVVDDLQLSLDRTISTQFVSDISNHVSKIISQKEKLWSYDLPEFQKDVSSIGISLDGTCSLIRKDGWKQTLVGTLSLYDADGERMHTIYVGEAPEAGKHSFHERFALEIKRLTALYPNIPIVGIADGAKDNWTFLNQYCTKKCIDFYHVSEYLARVAKVAFSDLNLAKKWLDERCHQLKHHQGVAAEMISEMETMRKQKGISLNAKDEIRICQGYFQNNWELMNFSEHFHAKLPIGSGVVEAACKTVVKQRLCNSGMSWSIEGSRSVLRLRALSLTKGRWEQFWGRVSRFGCDLVA